MIGIIIWVISLLSDVDTENLFEVVRDVYKLRRVLDKINVQNKFSSLLGTKIYTIEGRGVLETHYCERKFMLTQSCKVM